MTGTIAYIKKSLKELYPPSEVSSLVRLIMERVCNILPHHFLFCKDKELSESEKKRIHEIVERLKQMEPIQYILGTADFYSLQFEVDPSVLKPKNWSNGSLSTTLIRKSRYWISVQAADA